MLPAAPLALAVFTAAFSAEVAQVVTPALVLVAGAGETVRPLALAPVLVAGAGERVLAVPPPAWLVLLPHATSRAVALTRAAMLAAAAQAGDLTLVAPVVDGMQATG